MFEKLQMPDADGKCPYVYINDHNKHVHTDILIMI